MKFLSWLFSFDGTAVLLSAQLFAYNLVLICISGYLYKLSVHFEWEIYSLSRYYGFLIAMFLLVSLVVMILVIILTYGFGAHRFAYALTSIQGVLFLFFLYLFVEGFFLTPEIGV